jgi:chromosome segregation ATPase
MEQKMNQRLDAIKMEIEWQRNAIKDAEKRISRLKKEIEEFENQKCVNCNQIRSDHPVAFFKNFDEYSVERHYEEFFEYPMSKRIPDGKWTFYGGKEMTICSFSSS